jgi:hypothetical protein
VLAGIHVEQDGAGLAAWSVEELGQQNVVDALALLLGERGFDAREGRLAGEVGSGEGSAATGELEGGIVAKRGGVVLVFVARGDLIDALTDQVEAWVLYALGSPGVVAAGSDRLGEAERAIELGQQEEAAVGREGAAGEIDLDGLARKQRKVEHGLRIRHWRMFPFFAFSRASNLLYARQAKHPPSFEVATDQTATVSGM